MKNRYVLKLSGEAFSDEKGLSEIKVKSLCEDIRKIVNSGCKLAVVCGAGNIWRGRQSEVIDNIDADFIGMQATNINISLLYAMLKNEGIKCYCCSALGVENVIDSYDINKTKKLYNEGYVILVGGGIGLPGFTTDTAVVRRAFELDADVVLFGKSIDGVYDKDPHKFNDAKKYAIISPIQILKNQIEIGLDTQGVMDPEALVALIQHKIDIYVYKADDKSCIDKILKGENPGTIIKG